MKSVEELVDAQKRLIWFAAPTSNALAVRTDWCGSLRMVGEYYRDHMPELNQTVWDAARAAGVAGFNYRTEL